MSHSADVVASLQERVESHLSLLAPIEDAWQPTDLLPDLEAEDWIEQVSGFREAAQLIPDDILVVLVGNMVTEEALPNYTVALGRIAQDPTGTGATPWARWLRGWTAEENRHGDLLNTYLRLTGRVNMRSVERTVNHLIAEGFTTGDEDGNYGGLIYAAFQERATRISHGNVGRIARTHGEENLARICRKVAADEARHEVFYNRVVSDLFDRDPEGTLLAYRAMLKRVVSMPGSQMTDGRDPNLFDHFAAVVQRTGVYTSRDYASIIRHLNTSWGLETRSFSGKAAKVQEYLCRQPDRYEALADEIGDRIAERPTSTFSWIHGRSA